MNRLFVIAVLATFVPAVATAGELSKEECLDAHGKGQDAKDQGKLTLARKLFLSCAQPSCPTLVSNDCARFADDLGRQQPSVSLAARDGSGADLPDTTVYIDDVLVATRLDDGRPHEIDPGKHVVRFTNGGKEQVVTIVLGSGEQGRSVAAVFGPAKGSSAAASSNPAAPKPAPPQDTHPTGAKVLMIGGLVVTVAGAAFGAFELTRVPQQCSISTNQCAAAPGDQVFSDAQSAVHNANIGWVVTGIGLAAAIGGTVWYYTGVKHPEKEHFAIAPWASPDGGGFAVGGAW
ncbi:MAG TPA: hypothetical protein VFQ65_11245 [Kofleriaceae bacterium]|nr:hypothetical protein [Kofleriaceae bacterium]